MHLVFFICFICGKEAIQASGGWNMLLFYAEKLCLVVFNCTEGKVRFCIRKRTGALSSETHASRQTMHFIGWTIRSQNLGGRYTVGLGESPEQVWVQGSVPEPIQQLTFHVEGLLSSNSPGKMLGRRVENLEVGSPSPGKLINCIASGVAGDCCLPPVPREGSPPWWVWMSSWGWRSGVRDGAMSPFPIWPWVLTRENLALRYLEPALLPPTKKPQTILKNVIIYLELGEVGEVG